MKYVVIIALFVCGSLKAQSPYFRFEDSTFYKEQRMIRYILFTYDKSDIDARSKPTLDSLASFLKDHPKIHLEIANHQDQRGNDKYNQMLSERRAQCISSYLVQSKGIEAERLKAKGYGETMPLYPQSIIDQEPNQQMKEQLYYLNRRTEFIITSL